MRELIDDLAADAEDDFESLQLRGFGVQVDWASGMASGTGIANQSFRMVREVGDKGNTLMVNLGQGPEGVADALYTASAALLTAVDSVVNRYAPSLKDDMRRSSALIWRAWKDPERLTGLADDDECPCDRPGTKWGQCHKWTEELGTVEYVPISDVDILNFTPYDPTRPEPARLESRPPSGLPAGPQILTFTFKLPFTLGLVAGGRYTVPLNEAWADPDDVAHFGNTPRVGVRLHNQLMSGLEMWPHHGTEALRSFFGDREDAIRMPDWPSLPGAYEQWVTLETPGGRLESESADDPFYAFHRGLAVLNFFLLGLDLAVDDWNVREVSTREIGPVVFCGAWTADRQWVRVGELLMHPESWRPPLQPQPVEAMQPQLDAMFGDLLGGRLFLLANVWHSRALRAFHQRGDYADCVVSLQTATESMMYDLLRGLMVDEGKTAAEINAKVTAELPYRSLLHGELQPRLGGSWDLTSTQAVGRYWTSLYLLRNRVVHVAYRPG
ncbi:MAG: hypothetical protein M3024_00130, partial [Candidatus Dormibacteraeota bacterium]|nr:hypothetical protein [Candidatus Dormibacteraeota bacterium]